MDREQIVNNLEIQPVLDVIFNPRNTPKIWKDIDKLEQIISRAPREYGELIEVGTPGLYSRTLIMPAGMLCTSKIHKTNHQFIISKGVVTVYNSLDDTTVLFQAGDHGITHIGTRRVLYVHEECHWTTFHVTDKIKNDFYTLTEEEKQCIFNEVFTDIVQNYDNPLLEEFNEGIFI